MFKQKPRIEAENKFSFVIVSSSKLSNWSKKENLYTPGKYKMLLKIRELEVFDEICPKLTLNFKRLVPPATS